MSKINDKIKKCEAFFMELAELLSDDYEVVCAFDKTGSGSDKYLVRKGTSDQITYYGKPEMSFRCSTHWNWRADHSQCSLDNYIQCLNTDLPFAKRRPEEGKASPMIMAEQVAVVGSDGKYHAVYGEVFDRKKREWNWLEVKPRTVAVMMGLIPA